MPLVPLDLIDEPPAPVRTRADAAADTVLRESIAAVGLREQLAGKLPDWKPATFGAPGPKAAR